MPREYVTLRPRSADIDGNVNGEDYLARTVHEDHDLVDIGIVDKDGKPVMARQKMHPIGFVRWRNG